MGKSVSLGMIRAGFVNFVAVLSDVADVEDDKKTDVITGFDCDILLIGNELTNRNGVDDAMKHKRVINFILKVLDATSTITPAKSRGYCFIACTSIALRRVVMMLLLS
jgi:hypothetical protein